MPRPVPDVRPDVEPVVEPVVPVVEPVDGLPDRPSDVVRAVAHLAGARRLTALSGRWSGTGLLLAADPVVVVERAVDDLDADGLAALLDRAGLPGRGAGRPGVGGGWSVVLGHAVGRLTGRVRTRLPPRTGPRLPDLAMAYHDHVLRHDGRRWWAEALDSGDGRAVERALQLADEVRRSVGTGHDVPRAGPSLLTATPDAAAHMAAVEAVVTAVRAGEIAQANVCSRFALRLRDGGPSAVLAWADLVDRLGPERAALVTAPWGALVGASPETYLSVSEGRVRSRPIKGTRPAGEERSLAASAKDVSENVMIVDLVRNDLARVSTPGSVAVDELLAVQQHTGVTHLVSQVSGALVPGTGAGALLTATFPPGSVTGTPKQRATELTDAVETAARGAHTGAVGWLGPTLADLAVTIRSLEVAPDGEAALGVGGGIVADSTPAEEWHEVLTKAAPVLRALGADPPVPSRSTASAKGLADPSQGLLETVLAVDGRAVGVAEHVARLRRSVWELTGRSLDDDVEVLLHDAAAAAGAGAHRLRVRCSLQAPDGTDGPDGPDGPVVGLDVEPWCRPLPLAAQPGLDLAVVPSPQDGLERHKLADRRWVADALAAGPAGVDDVAFGDDSGALLETTRSSLVAVLAGTDGTPVLLTPPLDGRVLPGTTRQSLVDLAGAEGWRVRRGRLDTDALAGSVALLACNALRGAEWVRRLRLPDDDLVWQAPSSAVTRLGDALLARWRVLA